MADAIHEFSSDGSLSYPDIAIGHTVATTTGSQTAVVRDIALTIPGGKSVDFRIDDVTVAKQTGSGALSGTLLMKASQTIKMFPSENAIWTGMKAQQSAGTNSQYRNADLLKTSDYYSAPKAFDGSDSTRDSMSTKSNVYFTGSTTTVTSLTNGGDLASGSSITVYWADEHFNKPENDFYFTEYIDQAEQGSGYNHMKYYDASANTVTEIFNADSSYRCWVGGYSNKNLILRNASATFSSYKYLDTTTNTVSSAITIKRSNNAQATTFAISETRNTYSALDDYCIIRTNVAGYSTSDKLGLFRISDGMFNYWDTANSDAGNEYPIRNGGSYAWGGFKPALVKNTSGIYFIIWPWMQGTSTSQFGLVIYQLGTSLQLDTIVTSGTYGNPNGLNMVTRWRPTSGGGTNFDYRDFATGDSNTANKHVGPYNGFRPLKKPTPTDSTSRYWMHCGGTSGDGNFVLDMDNITDGGNSGDSTAGGMAYRNKQKFGTSSANVTWPNWYGEAETWTPTWRSSLLSSAYGTMKQRTTGILST